MFKKIIFLILSLMMNQVIEPLLGAHVESCVFCQSDIVEEQSVFQTSLFWILIDIEPRLKGHLLVVPKRHLAN